MNWYLTKLVFSIEIENKKCSQFDEQLRLVSALTNEEAFYKARTVGKNEAVVFKNELQKRVAWEFIDVSEVILIPDLKDGTEIYSHTHETQDANDYIRFVKHKASAIQSQHLVFV
jgi:hypothetical protein